MGINMLEGVAQLNPVRSLWPVIKSDRVGLPHCTFLQSNIYITQDEEVWQKRFLHVRHILKNKKPSYPTLDAMKLLHEDMIDDIDLYIRNIHDIEVTLIII